MPDRSKLGSAERALWESLGVEPIEHRLHLPSLGVEVRVQEVGKGEPVLFIHGGSSWGTSWADLVAPLTDFRCLLLDRPGTGLSDPIIPPISSIDELTRVADVLVTDVLDALDLESAHLVGTSFGGWFALRAALKAPQRTRNMAVVGWTGGAPVANLPLGLRISTLPVVGGLLARLPVTPAVVTGIFRSLGEKTALQRGNIRPQGIAAFAALLNDTETLVTDLSVTRLFLSARGLRDDSILLDEHERNGVKGRVTFIWGESDPFGGPKIAEPFVRSFPNATLELLEGAGHVPWFDEPEVVPQLIRTALND